LYVSFAQKSKLGERIRKQRYNDKKSLRTLAAECDMNYATLNDIEKGNGFPTEKVFLRLVENLNFKNKKNEYNLYAEIKSTAPPDVIDFLAKNKSAVEIVRQIMKENEGK